MKLNDVKKKPLFPDDPVHLTPPLGDPRAVSCDAPTTFSTGPFVRTTSPEHVTCPWCKGGTVRP